MEKIRFGTILYTGEDSLERLTEFKDEKIFIVTDPFIDKSGILEKVRSYITSSVETKVFSEVVPDPPIDTIILGISEAESFNPTIIIALGGGSAIDAAKGILSWHLMKQLRSQMLLSFMQGVCMLGLEMLLQN